MPSNEWNLWPYKIPPRVSEYMVEVERMTPAQKAFVAAASGVALVVGVRIGRIRPFWQRFTDVQDIPSSLFDTKAVLRGRCVSVSDGDTIRVRHVPTFFHGGMLDKSDKLSETTLSIRVCTIDTPETAKFGKSGQPFGQEAKDLLSTLLHDKMVHCRLLQKDQYGRAVAEVSTGRYWPFVQYADEKMLRAGLAEVYVGSGAVYGHRGKEYYIGLQETARQNNTGMWGETHHESAAEYKARTKPQ